MVRSVLLLLLLALSGSLAAKARDDDCEVCRAALGKIDESLSKEARTDLEKIEDHMRKWCDAAKGKDKTLCYYMGVGDAREGTSGGVKRDISRSLSNGINSKRLCNRLKKKDGQVRADPHCERPPHAALVVASAPER
jgi:hypothetical protein